MKKMGQLLAVRGLINLHLPLSETPEARARTRTYTQTQTQTNTRTHAAAPRRDTRGGRDRGGGWGRGGGGGGHGHGRGPQKGRWATFHATKKRKGERLKGSTESSMGNLSRGQKEEGERQKGSTESSMGRDRWATSDGRGLLRREGGGGWDRRGARGEGRGREQVRETNEGASGGDKRGSE